MKPEFPEYFDRKANQIVTEIKDLLREAYYEGYELGKSDMISIAEAILKGREQNETDRQRRDC
jgi:hypothetical protein